MRQRAAAGIAIVALCLTTPVVVSRGSNGMDRDPDGGSLYAALREQPHTTLSACGGDIAIVFADGAPGLDRERVVGFSHSAIRIHVGRHASEAAFRDDWILVHEMTQLALPTVPRQSDWLLEGNATYVEPIARAQAGQIDSSVVWRWAIEGMPKGQPQAGDAGLDHTSTWGRTYWGGATFWLQADWTVEHVMAAGDAATETHVLSGLYAVMRSFPAPVDMANLFRRLGVDERDGAIHYNDDAPLASIRRRITEPRQPPNCGSL